MAGSVEKTKPSEFHSAQFMQMFPKKVTVNFKTELKV